MKKQLIIFTFISIIFISCKKEASWDAPLNGKWIEVSNINTRALPSNCNIEFSDGVMIICDESIGKNLNEESKVHANKGQIWISYKLTFRKHEEYRYDYQFEDEYLWIMEETGSNYNPVINNPKAKKYRKQ